MRVQGEAAAPEITAMLEALSRDGAKQGIDAIVLTRGGGSIEDLWAFNEMSVALAVAACTLPVVAAIGHETDTTLAEVVADKRASTPTQAVMMLVPSQEELAAQLAHLVSRLRLLSGRELRSARQRLDAMKRVLRSPQDALRPAQMRVARLMRQMHFGMQQQCANTVSLISL